MTTNDRKRKDVRVSNKSPIAQPPKVAVQDRSSSTDPQEQPNAEIRTLERKDKTGPVNHEPEQTASNGAARNESSQKKDGPTGEDLADRCAKLEIERARMEESLAHSQSELAKAKEGAQNWQAKHSAAQKQLLQFDQRSRVLELENVIKGKSQDERDRDTKTRISSLMLDRDGIRERYVNLRGSLKNSEREVEGLRRQIKGLKDFVSTSSRVEGQVTDDVVAELMRDLSNGLQNWVIVNFRKSKIDLSSLSDEFRKELLSLVPTCYALATTAKLTFVQSYMSRLLVEEVFNHYFVGLSEQQATDLGDFEKYLRDISSAATANQFRSSTLALLLRPEASVLNENTSRVLNSVISRCINLSNQAMSSSLSDSTKASLYPIVKSAIDLSRMLRTQKARFETFMPVVGDVTVPLFDAESMEDIGSMDEDELTGRNISCVAFPGVIKTGDIDGEHSGEMRNVIVKAKVLCANSSG